MKRKGNPLFGITNARACVVCKKVTFEKIACVIGVCPQSAHRIHDELIVKLRKKLADDPYVKEWLKLKTKESTTGT